MDSQEQDKAFFKAFGKVGAGLVALAVMCVTLAVIVNDKTEHKNHDNAEALALVAERLAPIGKVITDPSALAPVATATAADEKPAQSGDQVYNGLCAACHAAGVMNAPKTGDKDHWKKLLDEAGGVDGLTKIAISGKNAMPPRGGNAALSDAEIHAAVEHMLKASGL
ncbi:cytochrome c5 family protein [Sinimarinibacterium sp. NLF-5-8]|uniref:c-type cytochrome n=1 Tax=Sinimarinibacterium sp. NLF-5-8 TaxID=2698684 RepID=UPI00137BB1E3|nr:c-type cytochrome [Sinimarinibacterium sp. NLF-5-8]QHS10442.1 cytochrome c5 family protein [Sinimarinibacterium sp. NLF-5-8]